MSAGGRYIILKNKKARELIAFLVCERGRPVRKTRLAETLWPDASPENAMSSLYKVFRYLRDFSRNGLTIAEGCGAVWLDMSGAVCDVMEFERLYADKKNVESCASAVKLYEAQLFSDECYEWISPYEAYYDVRYFEMAEMLASHYSRLHNKPLTDHYKAKLDGIIHA